MNAKSNIIVLNVKPPTLNIVNSPTLNIVNPTSPTLTIVNPTSPILNIVNPGPPVLNIVNPEPLKDENKSSKRIRRYTLPIFLERAKGIHGDKIDYSHVTEKDIDQGARSKVPLKCNICQYEWSPQIQTHINAKTGCPSCAGNVPWTLNRFLKKAKEIHGDKIDYSYVIKENINGKTSKVPLKCNICKHEWSPQIGNHINLKSGCPNCAGTAPWTLDRFLTKAIEIHGDKIDYSQVIKEHINGHISKVPLKCNICKHEWSPQVEAHIKGKTGCPSCAGKAPWTFDRFISKAEEIHGDKIDYSKVTKEHIKNGCKSRVPLKCNICRYEWSPTVSVHINGKFNCPDCAGTAPWTLGRFLTKAKEIHGDKIDYSQVIEEHINGYTSKVPLICNVCQYEWSPTISDHINGKCGCPSCAGKAPWSLDRFLTKANEIHGDKIDYSYVTEEHINGRVSKVPLKCNICKHEWLAPISSHINSESGCPSCVPKGYSKASIEWLKSIELNEGITIQCALSPEGEFKIPSPNNRYYRFDGYCISTNTVYEYHGDYWHGNPTIYDPNDINKTIGKSYGELYRKTIERENYIRSLGYNLVVRWETPFENVDI